VQRFDGGNFSKEWTPEFLEKKSVTKVLEDPEQGLWFTTLESGIFYVPNLDIKNTVFTTNAKIRAVLPYRNTFVAGDEAGFLYVFDIQKNQLVKKKDLGSSALTSFADNHNRLWISTVGTVRVFDTQLNELNQIGQFSANDFFEDRNGKVWSFGGHAIRSFDGEANTDYIRFLNRRYRSMYVDDSLIYLGGRIGLDLYDRAMNLKDSPGFFANVKIADIVPITDSTLLMSTLGSGVIILNKYSLHTRQYSSKNKFVADNIYAVQKSGNIIWLATEKGLARTDVASLHNENPSFEYLNKTSGLISDKINHLIVKPDRLLAFSDEGFSSIQRPIQRFANKTPGFYIKRIEVNQSLRKIADLSNLRHSENNISIDFGYKSFNNPAVYTRYRLHEEDPWILTTNKNIELIALAPGNYNFQLEHSVDNVHWIEASSFPIITIYPPWWQTWYFRILAGVVITILVYFFFRYQVNIYREHQIKLIRKELEAIEQERKRIAKDLHDSVGTDFSAIKMMVSQVLKKHNEPKSEEIETQFQSTIQDIKSIIYGLSPPGLERYGLMAGLKNYVDKLNGSIAVTIQLETFGPEIKNTNITITVFRIIQELISNSLKHSKANIISLHINSFEDLINIVYEDNGKGFTWQDQGKGLGLYNIESRLQSLNGQLRFDSGDFGISYAIDIPLRVHSSE
jgi:two-component sensor histidine kinase